MVNYEKEKIYGGVDRLHSASAGNANSLSSSFAGLISVATDSIVNCAFSTIVFKGNAFAFAK